MIMIMIIIIIILIIIERIIMIIINLITVPVFQACLRDALIGKLEVQIDCIDIR